MTLSVVLQTHDFLSQRDLPNVRFKVDSLRWAALGGPESATITADGDLAALEELIDLVGEPLQVWDEKGRRVWYGYLYEATVQNGALEYGATMEGMANAVCVAYDDGKNGRQTTAWATDSASVERYGYVEKKFTTSSRTATQCEQLRDTKLALLAHPLPILRDNPGGVGQKATLSCKGWYHSLNRRYYSTSGLVQQFEMVTGAYRSSLLIDDFAFWKYGDVYQRITFNGSAAWWLDKASFVFNWGDVPLHVALTGPGVSATGTYPQEPYTWNTFLPVGLRDGGGNRPVLQPGVQYTFHFYQDSRTPFRWQIQLGDQQGADAIQFWNGEGAFLDSLPYTAFYRLEGFVDSAQQIADAVSAKGDFITAVDQLDLSGIETDPKREGDQKLGDIAEDLLETGSVNNLRLLCRVTDERRLQIYEEPLPDLDDVDRVPYVKRADGKLEDRFGNLVPPATNVAGQWCIRKDGLPPASAAAPTESALVFIESCEYSGDDEGLTVEPRVLQDMFQFFDLEEG